MIKDVDMDSGWLTTATASEAIISEGVRTAR